MGRIKKNIQTFGYITIVWLKKITDSCTEKRQAGNDFYMQIFCKTKKETFASEENEIITNMNILLPKNKIKLVKTLPPIFLGKMMSFKEIQPNIIGIINSDNQNYWCVNSES